MIDPELVAAVRLQYGRKVDSRGRPSQNYSRKIRETVSKVKSPTSRLVLWILLVGMFMPPTVAFFLGTFKLSAGRIVLIMLFIPAIKQLFNRPWHFVWSDPLVAAAVLWITGSRFFVEGINATSFMEGFEFIGFYVLGRALFFQPAAINEMLPILRIVAVLLLAFAFMDFFTNTFVVNELGGKIFRTVTLVSQRDYSHFHRELFGRDVIRATSTFDHPILYGTFCSIVGAIFLFAESGPMLKIFGVGICFVGVVLSGSSAALLGSIIYVGVYVYNLVFRKYNSRWKVFVMLLVAAIITINIVIAHPLNWIILHLTFDPVSGYYRILEWDAAIEQIKQHPYIGFGSGHIFDNEFLDVSIDSVWLALALKYGVPASVLLMLSGFVLFLKNPGNKIEDREFLRTRTIFTLINALFIFIGFTVFYWNSMWQFWGLCLGIRASLEEYLNQRLKQRW
jgi:O-antigen ligase